MAIDREALLRALDKFDEGLAQLETLRVEGRTKMKAILKTMNALTKACEKAESQHVEPEGLFAEDPDGKLIDAIVGGERPYIDDDTALSLFDKDTWQSHLEISNRRSASASFRKVVKK